MSENIVYTPFKESVDLMGDKSVMVNGVGRISPAAAMAEETKLYERCDLFVKSFRMLPTANENITVLDPTVFLQDTVEKQHGGKIASFVRRINEIVNDVHEMASGKHTIHIVPVDWKAKPYKPTITLSIKCDDTVLGQKSQKIISTLNSAIQSGVNVNIVNKCAPNSAWNTVVNAMIANQNQH